MSAGDEDVTFNDEELVSHMTVNTPLVQDDHVRIILKWEKDPRSAVVALGKLAKEENYLLQLFAAATALATGDESVWDDAEESE